MDQLDRNVIEDIQDRLGNGRPPVEPEHFEGTQYDDEDDYYDHYEVSEATGDPASERGAKFTARDGDRTYIITIRRELWPDDEPSADEAGRYENRSHRPDGEQP